MKFHELPTRDWNNQIIWGEIRRTHGWNFTNSLLGIETSPPRCDRAVVQGWNFTNSLLGIETKQIMISNLKVKVEISRTPY